VRAAEVFFEDRLAGRLEEFEGQYSFQYQEDYLSSGRAVSFSLPLRKETYSSSALPAFFEGLLPEGWCLRMICQQLKLDPEDSFGLLLATCDDCVGAVSIRKVD
jgi:serine/threonine-protein kinase HipA